MIKKQIIGFVLMSLTVFSTFIFLEMKSQSDIGVVGFTFEMFYFICGLILFLVLLAAGAFIFQKKKTIYWSTAWSISAVIAGTLALWILIISTRPAGPEWEAIEQVFFYLTGLLPSQASVLLAVLGWRTSCELGDKKLLLFPVLCLGFSSIAVFLFIIRASSFGLPTIGFLVNLVPLLITVPLLLLILKKREKRIV